MMTNLADMGLAVAAQIRAIYIPQVILWLHQMLFETREFIPGYII
jgi:hypothetical protein